MGHFYQFAKVTNQAPIQGFLEIEVVNENWLMGPANPGSKKHVEIQDQTEEGSSKRGGGTKAFI